MSEKTLNSFKRGVRDGVPIGLGYLSVSFAFGITVVSSGLSALTAASISMTNLTSAGQVAGLAVILAAGTLGEMALTQLVINLRYALMSMSLSQRLADNVGIFKRMLIAFFITDEVFALASDRSAASGKYLGDKYMYGLAVMPYIGWSAGTVLGALSGNILPLSLRNALGVAIYGMFIAIIVPPSKKNRGVLFAVLIAVLLSCVMNFVPQILALFEGAPGFVIIICAVSAAVLAAIFFPKTNEEVAQ